MAYHLLSAGLNQKVRSTLRFSALSALKVAGYVLYPSKLSWVSPQPKSWSDVSLILVLNHTSLFEFVYGIALPFSFLKEISERLIIPVADSTMKTRFGRLIFSNLAPKTLPLSRKRDESWTHFLESIESKDICIFMPEGRMKRPGGLDKDGKPMTVKGGVADLLTRYAGKQMVIVYSQGLHHILAPGQKCPRVFRKVAAKVEAVMVDDYVRLFADAADPRERICRDLERRRNIYCEDSVPN